MSNTCLKVYGPRLRFYASTAAETPS